MGKKVIGKLLLYSLLVAIALLIGSCTNLMASTTPAGCGSDQACVNCVNKPHQCNLAKTAEMSYSWSNGVCNPDNIWTSCSNGCDSSTGKCSGSTTIGSCSDGDNTQYLGDNTIYIKSSVTFAGTPYSDWCITSNTLGERYCDSSGGSSSVSSYQVPCSNGCVNDGMCISQQAKTCWYCSGGYVASSQTTSATCPEGTSATKPSDASCSVCNTDWRMYTIGNCVNGIQNIDWYDKNSCTPSTSNKPSQTTQTCTITDPCAGKTCGCGSLPACGGTQSCGNGIKEGTEQCDLGTSGNGICPNTCSASCTTNSCGSGTCKPIGGACDGTDYSGTAIGHTYSTECVSGFCWEDTPLSNIGSCQNPVCCQSSSSITLRKTSCVSNEQIISLNNCKLYNSVLFDSNALEQSKTNCGGGCAGKTCGCGSLPACGGTQSIATQLSMTEKDLEQATPEIIVQGVCKVSENCIDYKDIQGNSNYTETCISTPIIKGKIKTAIDAKCDIHIWDYVKFGTGISGVCAALFFIPTGITQVVGGVCLTTALGGTLAASSGAYALESGCVISKEHQGDGLCIATPTDTDNGFLSSIGQFVRDTFGLKTDTDNKTLGIISLILFIGGIVVIGKLMG